MVDQSKISTRGRAIGALANRVTGWIDASRGAMLSLSIAAAIHAALFLYDCISGFAAFTTGDRSWTRLEAMTGVLNAPSGDHLSAAAAAAVAPGEYLLQLPFYLIGGPAAVILFQILLALAAARCVWRIADNLFGPRLATAATLIFALLPQSLVFPHQFVTETAVAAFCIFFVSASLDFLKAPRWPQALWAGLWLGLAIFIRPSFAVILPLLPALFLIFRARGLGARLGGGLAMAALALAPLMLWTAAFTATTGQIGYTSGVANLDWNLRSRVYLVQSRNGLPLAPEVAQYQAYEELYGDAGGIGVARFFEIAAETPGPFIRSAVIDEAIVFGRANLTSSPWTIWASMTARRLQWRDVLNA